MNEKKTISTLIFLLTGAVALSCNYILKLPKEAKINRIEWHSIPSDEVIECLPDLGRRKLDLVGATVIWGVIARYHKGIPNIPNEILSSLGWVTLGIKPEDYEYLTLNEPEVISNFGNYYNLTKKQLNALINRVREDFGNKQPEDYTGYDLMILKHIICALDGREIVRIHPKAYREAALMIGRLKKCDSDVLAGFAALTIDDEAFGPPDKWKRSTICLMGQVAKHLPKATTAKLKEKLGWDFLSEADKNITKEKDCKD